MDGDCTLALLILTMQEEDNSLESAQAKFNVANARYQKLCADEEKYKNAISGGSSEDQVFALEDKIGEAKEELRKLRKRIRMGDLEEKDRIYKDLKREHDIIRTMREKIKWSTYMPAYDAYEHHPDKPQASLPYEFKTNRELEKMIANPIAPWRKLVPSDPAGTEAFYMQDGKSYVCKARNETSVKSGLANQYHMSEIVSFPENAITKGVTLR